MHVLSARVRIGEERLGEGRVLCRQACRQIDKVCHRLVARDGLALEARRKPSSDAKLSSM